ncbi:MAG: DUF3365 domain-containing protein [Bacteroidales bacterium]|nr:DUF3365 domain-containing protein [Bacteroidales bacterium]
MMCKSGLFISLFFIFLISCNTNPDIRISEPSMVEIERIHPVGETVAKDLMLTLQKELQAALAGGNFRQAIKICERKAIPITITVAQREYSVTDLKRVTRKYRNPANAPDSVELLALEYFDELFARQNDRPDNFIQKITGKDGSYFNYYKPIYTNGLCLSCHGPNTQMDQEVLHILDSLYPGDMARGYNAGDFRGLIKVQIRD